MTLEELQSKYNNVPLELKSLKRWVCWNLETKEDGTTTKVPKNAMSGSFAAVNNKNTWCSFNIALNGVIKYGFTGIGFVLGDGIFGVDLDNHPDQNGECLSQEEFDNLSKEFINGLNSYTEYSQSGKGIHIICYGKIPEGGNRRGNVEIYDKVRYFAFTGNVINQKPIENREEEIKPLWGKYIGQYKKEKIGDYQMSNPNNLNGAYTFKRYDDDYKVEVELSDEELIRKACDSKNGMEFASLYRGDLSSHGNDHSAADMAFCSMLAFWCNNDKNRMDRIFRKSGLMRHKWDEMRGSDTYGNITLANAVRGNYNGYVNLVNSTPNYVSKPKPTNFSVSSNDVKIADMNIDENGEPIFRIKKNYKKYPFNDTGNAHRFYDYFGDLFKHNKTDNYFMFWTGKTWIKDTKNVIRKYANKMIDILKEELANLKQEYNEDPNDELDALIKAAEKNVARFSNKAGKDAMLSEFEDFGGVPVESSEFDKDIYLLNTDSGVVDLRTGVIKPFDPSYMLSRNTNTKVSFEEPTEWIKFLNSIFLRDNLEETKQIVDCMQLCAGYSTSGSTSEQCMFFLYGSGSNGKSTFIEQISKVLGDYASSTPSSTLIQPKNGPNNAVMYSIAKLKESRFVQMGETDDGDRLAEANIKRLTGGDVISAQFKYGNEFDFKPKFKIWCDTNSRPIIRGTDFGIWRRIFLFPFLRRFTDKEKDKNLPSKLAAESDKILGWCIKGFKKYYENGGIDMPECLKNEINVYKEQMDVITQFVSKQCVLIDTYKTSASLLYQAYKLWAKEAGEYAMRESKFEEELKNKGIKLMKFNGEPFYVGIKLNADKSKNAYVFDAFDRELAY